MLSGNVNKYWPILVRISVKTHTHLLASHGAICQQRTCCLHQPREGHNTDTLQHTAPTSTRTTSPLDFSGVDLASQTGRDGPCHLAQSQGTKSIWYSPQVTHTQNRQCGCFWLCLCMWVCVCMCLGVCVCVFGHVCIYVGVFAHGFALLCLRVCVFVFVPALSSLSGPSRQPAETTWNNGTKSELRLSEESG